MARFQLAATNDIAPNTMRGFQASGQRILIVNLDGTFYGLQELCPHLSVPLSRGQLKDGCITCAGHGSQFDVKTGQAKKWVGKPITWLTRLREGKPTNPRVYPLIVENGQIFVEL